MGYSRPGTRAMALGSEQIVGRAAELGALDDALDEVATGRFVSLQVVGEPGMGKTRLLRELADRADTRGHLVLVAARPSSDELPFWVFVDALDDYPEGLEPRRLEALGERDARGAGARLSDLSPWRPAPQTPDERYRMHRAARDPVRGCRSDAAAGPDARRPALGGLRARSSCSARCSGCPPSASVLIAVAVRPRQQPERLSRHARTGLRRWLGDS